MPKTTTRMVTNSREFARFRMYYSSQGDHWLQRRITVSANEPKKEFGPVDRWREASGLYKLGFDGESFKGFVLPFLCMAIPAVIALLIWRYL
jgi:hypothetical protein